MNVALVSLIFFVIPMCQPFPFITRSLRSIMFPLHSVILLLSLSNDHDLIICVKWSRSAPLHLIYLYIYIYICMSICFHQIICVAGFCCPPLFRMARAACGAGASSPAFWYSKSFPFFIFFPRCFCFPCFLFCRG